MSFINVFIIVFIMLDCFAEQQIERHGITIGCERGETLRGTQAEKKEETERRRCEEHYISQ